MEFREISTFLQVAQHQSFSKAAKQLGYSQAAVTIQIKQLEGELGVHLFDRIGKQISLTHQGQIFYQYAVAIQKDLEQARSAVSDSSSLNGKLCLGTIETGSVQESADAPTSSGALDTIFNVPSFRENR